MTTTNRTFIRDATLALRQLDGVKEAYAAGRTVRVVLHDGAAFSLNIQQEK